MPDGTTFNAQASTPGWNCADGVPAGTVCTYDLYVSPSGVLQIINFGLTVDTFVTSGERTTNAVALEDDGLDRNRANNTNEMEVLIVMPVRQLFPIMRW
ncbi:MAG: hypothetical protein AAF702_11180 [Chloroflexota bacterium]